MGRSLFQPVACFGQLAVLPLTVKLTELELGLTVAGSCCLAQQFETDAAITLAVAVMTEQASQSALCFNYTFECRLLEHPTRDTFNTLGLS